MTLRKRLFDLFFASLLVVILGPVILFLVAYIYVKQGRPLFYVAERMKTPDQSFGLIKFRTMTVVDSDQEFPQLWNILKGDLSFVGPRPPLREYVERFPDIYAQVLKSRPGVTGLATIKFHKHEERLLSRCNTAEQTEDVYCRTCVPRKAKLDLIYQRNQNVCYDFDLVFQTIGNLFRRGAAKARRKG